jgi:hypothetical protein
LDVRRRPCTNPGFSPSKPAWKRVLSCEAKTDIKTVVSLGSDRDANTISGRILVYSSRVALPSGISGSNTGFRWVSLLRTTKPINQRINPFIHYIRRDGEWTSHGHSMPTITCRDAVQTHAPSSSTIPHRPGKDRGQRHTKPCAARIGRPVALVLVSGPMLTFSQEGPYGEIGSMAWVAGHAFGCACAAATHADAAFIDHLQSQ